MSAWMRISNPIDYLASKLNNFSNILSNEEQREDLESLSLLPNDFESNISPNTLNQESNNNGPEISNFNKVTEKGKTSGEANLIDFNDKFNILENVLYETQLSSFIQWSNHLRTTEINFNSSKSVDSESLETNTAADEVGNTNNAVNVNISNSYYNQQEVSGKIINLYGKSAIDEITLEHIEL
ncbi:hypothetical protein AYI70_g3790 [Smittium culicis]|uniref:Uncharacterized protein n=1 Tax=Smittium culicis TaxID=133412 RepID=A0A1R1Y2B9_9FUNG|nr:hypothetical protein AYI70_g9249 [Smittium culicis]OMJ20924.1 hypothetical protein AYI70_g3790 [Smittium culicis]